MKNKLTLLIDLELAAVKAENARKYTQAVELWDQLIKIAPRKQLAEYQHRREWTLALANAEPTKSLKRPRA
jgi:hypothetical protein